MNVKSKDLTQGSITKALIALAGPIIFANILQTAYQLTDTFWVGRLGANAVAAVSLSFPVIFLLISLGAGFATAGTILVGQYKGKKDQKQINHVSTQTLILSLLLSAVLSIIGYFLTRPIIRLMGAEAQVFEQAVSYLQISFLGMIFVFGFFIYQSLMRGIGEVKVPLYIVLGTVLLNLVLDPLFIMGYGPIPAYGVTGAAIATIGTQGLATIIGLIMLFSGKYGIHLRKKDLKIDLTLMKKLFKLGFPASIQQSSRALNFTVMTILVASFGTIAVAAYGIGFRILSFVIIPALGLMMANSTLVSQNIGAQRIERAEKTSRISAKIGFSTLSLAGILVFFFATPLATAFIPGDQVVIDMSANFIRIMALTFGFISIQQVLMGTLIGAGSTKSVMFIAIITSWVINLPLAYILSKFTSLGIVGLWWSFPIANVSGAILAYFLYKKGDWKEKKLIEG